MALAKLRHRARFRGQRSWLGYAWQRVQGSFLHITIGYGYRSWLGLIWLLGFFLLGWVIFARNGPTQYNDAGLNLGGSGVIKPAIAVVYTQPLTRYQHSDENSSTPGRTQWRLQREDTPITHAIKYALPIEYPAFSAFWYSLDTLIPLVDLGQETAWSPSPIRQSFAEDRLGWCVQIYLYIHIIMGWILTSLTVVAMTGIIKQKNE